MSSWFDRFKLMILAIVGTATFHAGLLLHGTYRGTYDAWVHIFFADHYARSWWNPWEPRWYTGYIQFSYPPLSHQLTALISKFSSLPTGFIVVMLGSTIITTIGVYRFSRLWVDERPATYAALLAVFSSSIAETVHVFGQLPTMFVIGVMLNALPFVYRWVDEGKTVDLARAWALLMVAAAGHHVTTLFGMVFFSGPILATVLLLKFRTARKEETVTSDKVSIGNLIRWIWRRWKRIRPAFFRCGIFGVGLIMILVITVLPYWLWSRSDPITQITIPHSSRDSFFENRPAGLMFFWIPWGVLLFIIPYAYYKGFGGKNWILASSLAMLSLLGTGGTTPIPAMLLRGAFYILTLDRFTFWATIVILPFAGLFVESLLHGRVGQWITAHFGSWWRTTIAVGLGLSLFVMALFTANLTQYRRFQPDPLDMTPIVEFLAKDNHDKWRYMTLGFGDQMAWLGAQTTALNAEGNYHSARRLPEMTSTPVERMDGAKFTSIPGLGSLQAFVTNPQKYNLKYIFANDAFYEPLLHFAGWHRIGLLANDVIVWERADVPPLPAQIPAVIYPAWQRFMWGVLPVGSIFVVMAVFFYTYIIIPRLSFSIFNFPIIGWVLRWKWLRNWMLDNPASEPDIASEDWQLWRKFTRRCMPEIRLKPLHRRVLYGGLLGLLILVTGLLIARQWHIDTQSPEAVLLAYYDDIDFKRFSDSYQYLSTDLTREEYLRWLSLQGGLVASFAKLDNLYTDIHPLADGSLRVGVELDWLTSIGIYPQETEHIMVQENGQWRILLETEVPPLPRETFISTPQLTFYQDLPVQSLDVGALNRGTLDRSLLSISPVKIMYAPEIPIGFQPEVYDAGRIEGRFEGLISIIGAVTNNDTFPAHITINAILRDKNGMRLAQTNAMDMVIHQLLPGETTPFRVDFFGFDAADLLDLSEIVSADLAVQGVPTSHNLDRPLSLLEPGVLYNGSPIPVDIPRVIFSYTDENDEFIWVDGAFLELAIKPDDVGYYEQPPLPNDLVELDVPVQIDGPRLVDWDSRIPSLVIHGYTR